MLANIFSQQVFVQVEFDAEVQKNDPQGQRGRHVAKVSYGVFPFVLLL